MKACDFPISLTAEEGPSAGQQSDGEETATDQEEFRRLRRSRRRDAGLVVIQFVNIESGRVTAGTDDDAPDVEITLQQLEVDDWSVVTG